MTKDDGRKGFEDWIVSDGGHPDLTKRAITGEYEEEWVSNAYWGWQAAMDYKRKGE